MDATKKSVLGFLYDQEKTFFKVTLTLKNSRIDVDIDHDISTGEATA